MGERLGGRHAARVPSTSSRPRLRRRSREAVVFSVAAALALAHAFDDAFLAGLGTHALAGAVALAATLAAVAAFPSLRPGVRAAIAFSFGGLALANGGRHLHHILNVGTTANDVTGALAAAAGVVLVGLAAWIPFRHRGEGASTPPRRWLVRLLVVPAALVSLVMVLGPIGLGMVDIHSLQRPVGDPPDATYRTVHFTASDGVRLEGWYRPSANGATVLMLSGGGGNRRSTLRHAEMLVRHGYGVLVYDPRGSGRSEGMINSYGWGWEKDATAAFDYLARRDDVDPRRIGALGLSTGADIAIDLAARRPGLKGIVADGAAAISWNDWKRVRGDDLAMIPGWFMFKSMEVITGRSQPKEALADQIARSHSRSLIVSASKDEKDFGELYDRAGGTRSELWYLPHATHTGALRQYPRAYERRVARFFDETLQG
jgi:uncharacterized protein